MTSFMKISIITATYNSEATLQSCMLSVLEQSYQNIEYVIIDGQSKDGTLEIIKNFQVEFPKVIFKIVSEPDKGIYDALNKGIALATGDVIGFVHSDDVLAHSQIIESIANQFKTQELDGIYGDLQYVNKTDITKVFRRWKSCDFNKKLLKKGWMPAHPTLYLKKAVYNQFGGFNTNYSIAADYDFILRIFKNEQLKFYYLPEVILKMRVGGESNRNLNRILLKMKEDYLAIRGNKVGNASVLLFKNVSKLNQFF